MFGLLKGSMSFDGSVFWRMIFEIVGHGSCCSGGCRCKVHLRWYGHKVVVDWTILYIITILRWFFFVVKLAILVPLA
jgi:hypothetical protein